MAQKGLTEAIAVLRTGHDAFHPDLRLWLVNYLLMCQLHNGADGDSPRSSLHCRKRAQAS